MIKESRSNRERKEELESSPSVRTHWLIVRGAEQNNLRNVDAGIPLGRFVCVTGVSGSGKSSLVNEIIYEQLARDLNGAETTQPGKHRAIEGKQHLDKIIAIDQSPIGRTPRSNPSTYIKLFDEVRDLYTKLPDSQVRGYKPGRFSFNVSTGENGGGRCDACEGNGANRIEMDFLADVWVTCPVCNGKRFNHETLQVLFKGKSIHDVLDMDVQQALAHFENVPKIRGMLQTLHDVGLDYIKLGQSSTTLSGGEAQRVKLARELVKKSTGRTLYLLDEPTTGLHFEDIRRLLAVLHGFVDAGNTVLCIEHNLDVIKTADWVIDLGPEGGAGGGLIVATGTPEDVAACEESFTGQALQSVLASRDRSASAKRQADSKAAQQSLHAARTAGGAHTSFSILHSKFPDGVHVIGAREHNLKDVTVSIPRGAMTVCSGVSGSGKTSFAIDTVYTEGQRRYVESLSAYARQFLGQLQKPKVDHVYGLSPAIAIEQKSASKSPRSTVGTVTEIYDYMRVLWARAGQAYCPKCEIPIGTQSSEEIADAVATMPEGAKLLLCAPVARGQGESWDALMTRCSANGYARIRVDGVVHELSQPPAIDARSRHDVELVVDRIVVQGSKRRRIADTVEQCLAVGDGVLIVVDADSGTARRFSQHFACDRCGTSYDELTPHHFSFNARMGWCPHCEGLGVQRGTRPDAIIVRPNRSIVDGAVAGWQNVSQQPLLAATLSALAGAIGFDPNTPYQDLTDGQRHALLFGLGDRWVDVAAERAASSSSGKKARTGQTAEAAPADLRFQWKGFFPAIDEATRMSWKYRTTLEELVTDVPCQRCSGGRVRPEAAAVRFGGRTIVDVCSRSLSDAAAYFDGLKLDRRQQRVAGELLHEIRARLRFLLDVGLEYLTLDRAAPTLSGGESQRIRLASQIGSGLTGVLYVLDEPTIGLHPRDNRRLIAALHKLRDLGNTLLMVEHDREVIDASDHLLDFGPGAGSEGGRLVAEGSPKELRKSKDSLTGRYLAGREAIPVPTNRRDVVIPEDGAPLRTPPERSGRRGIAAKQRTLPTTSREASELPSPQDASPSTPMLVVAGARQNNLKEIDVAFPIGRFICVTGVSGSGKSSLVTDILYPALAARIHRARVTPGGHDQIRGIDHIDKIINVDQQPIGNSPLSNAATYTGVFDLVRELFAKLPESKVRGYTANRFSFNRAGGRCEACEGLGQVCHEMHFLPDVWVPCETCGGARYGKETLEVRYKGKSISDVLNTPVAEALEHFSNVPKVRRMLQTLVDVGLGYLPLGQAAPTLSGGEAQRIKLAAELGRPNTGKTLYVLDEPTTGLHLDDLRKLLDVLHRLVDLGNTVICIEHNLDVIKTADWVIDMGPEAGAAGGQVVVAGSPEEVATHPGSHTGRVLADLLKAGPHAERCVFDAAAAARAAQQEKQAVAPEADASHEIRMPWQTNGRKWHTEQRISRNGESVEWEGEALAHLMEIIEEAGGDDLLPTNWNDRVKVEVMAKAPDGLAQSAVPWFIHALTGGRWLLETSIRVPRGTFTTGSLQSSLKLKSLDDRDDIPAYGRTQRVRVGRARENMDTVRVLIHDLKEISTPAFRAFMAKAVKSYLRYVSILGRDIADASPWKADGKAWHLSQKSMGSKSVVQWKSIALVELLGQIHRAIPGMRVDWSKKVLVGLENAEGRRFGRIVTNDRSGLRVQVFTPPGRFTPTMIEQLGIEQQIETEDGTARVTFRFQSMQELHLPSLRSVLSAAVMEQS